MAFVIHASHAHSHLRILLDRLKDLREQWASFEGKQGRAAVASWYRRDIKAQRVAVERAVGFDSGMEAFADATYPGWAKCDS